MLLLALRQFRPDANIEGSGAWKQGGLALPFFCAAASVANTKCLLCLHGQIRLKKDRPSAGSPLQEMAWGVCGGWVAFVFSNDCPCWLAVCLSAMNPLELVKMDRNKWLPLDLNSTSRIEKPDASDVVLASGDCNCPIYK